MHRVIIAVAAFVATLRAQSPSANTQPAIRLEEALPTISWEQARDYIGKEVFAVGKIVKSSRARAGHAFLNFDNKRDGGGLVIFINKDHYAKFPQPPEHAYRDKRIKVRGFVTEFK